MSQYFHIHPDNPQGRLIKQACEIIHAGGIVAVPTDSCYALVCHLDDKDAVQRMRRIRNVDEKHHLTLLCRDLTDIATYARLDNRQYRLLKAATPGPYTFILEATKEVPRRLSHPSTKTIGIRVPEDKIMHALLTELSQPLLGTTLILPNQELPLTEPEAIRDNLNHQLELIIDGGACGLEPTSVINLVDGEPLLLRAGRGDLSIFGL